MAEGLPIIRATLAARRSHTGAILEARRLGAHLTCDDLARVDDDWTPARFAEVELEAQPATASVVRYLLALERWERAMALQEPGDGTV